MEMQRLTFGDRCSPFVTISVVHRIAEDFKDRLPEAAAAVKQSLYVGDYLDSPDTAAEAIERAVQVRSILAFGDFHLRNWVSNCPTFLYANEPISEAVPVHQEIALASPDTTTILGVCWRPGPDVLSFAIHRLEEVVYTRSGLLRKVTGVFDPLGLATPCTIQANIRLKVLNLGGPRWDAAILNQEHAWWRDWLERLPQINDMNRCLFPDGDDIVTSQLHTFVDASEEAFAAAIYILNVYHRGKVMPRLGMAKAKQAPRKTLSVVKLELQAALLGTILATYVQLALSRPLSSQHFWTDNSCLRTRVRSTSSYKIFVSHRIGRSTPSRPPKNGASSPGG